MKTTSLAVWLTLLLTALPGCALAQQLVVPPTHPVTVRAYVHDPDGRPVEGATVTLSFTYYRGKESTGQSVRQETAKDGFAMVSGTAEAEYRIRTEKSGYYRTIGPVRYLDTEVGLKKYATGTQAVDIELRPIRDQVVGIHKGIEKLRIPALDKPFGFDLEVGDWVTPDGRGKIADLIFKLDGYFNSPDDYSFKLNAILPGSGDGLQAVQVEPLPERGSAFQLPYEAPLTGYHSSHIWERSHIGKERTSSGEWKGGTVFLFRIRTVLDSNGNVVRALYGYMDGNVDYRGTPEQGVKLSFTYWLNPEWTRSLEADPKKTVTVVQP
ncbi:MAG: carboxypeptidase regulatory-like domain-containing protein [Opitutae bacterium]|nr:carboxypeptidase regulatory-like domain-containing protein [Opitutae bacterium]